MRWRIVRFAFERPCATKSRIKGGAVSMLSMTLAPPFCALTRCQGFVRRCKKCLQLLRREAWEVFAGHDLQSAMWWESSSSPLTNVRIAQGVGRPDD